MSFNVVEIIQLVIILLVSIGVHEFVHAWTSDKLGDPTPKMMGRLTPNPLAHIDPVGFLMIFIINFGWGKPVITNPSYYRRPLRDELLVAFAGPLSNIILACLAVILILLFSQISLGLTNPALISFWEMFAWMNCGMAVFNMMPLPPLDGWRLIKLFFPGYATKLQYLSYQYGWITFALLFVSAKVISPFVVLLSQGLYHWIHAFFFALFMLL